MRTLVLFLVALALLAVPATAQSERTDLVRLFTGPGDTAYVTSLTRGRVSRTDDGGVSWQPVSPFPDTRDGYSFALTRPVVTSNGVILAWEYARQFNSSSYNTQVRSDDGGQTWTEFEAGGNPADHFAVSIDGGFVIAGYGDGRGGNYRRFTVSRNDGFSWRNAVGPDGRQSIETLRFGTAVAARGDFAAIYNGVEHVGICDDGSDPCSGVARSEDRGVTWMFTETTGFEEAESTFGFDLVNERARLGPDGTLYAWTRGEETELYQLSPSLYRLPPQDSVWTRVALPDSATEVRALDVGDDGAVHFGTDKGALVSRDHGASWTRDGLEGAVTALERTQAGTLLALADRTVWRRTGEGVWSQGRVPVSTSSQIPNVLDAALTVQPNPASHSTRVEVVGLEGDATVEAFDVLGRLVATIHTGPMTRRLQLEVEIGSWPPGVYVVRANGERGTASTQITVTR
ncbi:T9SS type A sorting domain-containing protein [Rubrivirga sp.]|uniref:T9SS type A sorting domain-containing protein n=1 Tax=Rubrivirga sp. TaxID=1885344 RepID=UPI003C70D945